MSKKVYADDLKNEQKLEETQKSTKKSKKSDDKEESSEVGASGFSDEAEKKFQAKKKSRLEKLHNVVSKGLIPPNQKTTTEQKKGKWRDLSVRVKWSLIMVSLVFLIIAMGSIYTAIMVGIIIIAIFYELLDIGRFKERNLEVKNYYLVSWYILSLGMYYSYILVLKDKIILEGKFKILLFLLKYHKFICFMLYCFGFLLFLKSLTKGYYRYQFQQFAYVHIIFLIFGFLSSLIISNIFHGMIWFLVPVSCVVINDIGGYMFGKLFGKHPLSSLSPNKTIEGFVGALFSTMVWCYFWTKLLCLYEPILCPIEKVTFVPFKLFKMTCDVSELLKKYEISFNVLGFVIRLSVTNIQCHTLIIGLFASLIAPLGGLFASGFKRSLKIKDFADTIPGHGGVTDRMDCELLNGAFVYVYLSQFVFFDGAKIVDNIIKKIMRLSSEEQLAIYEKLKNVLGKE